MKKIAVLMAFVMILLFSGCSSERETEIVKKEETIKPVQLTVPEELQGYDRVRLMDFDGQYGVFCTDRINEADQSRVTAGLVVYDAINEKTVQKLDLNMENGSVIDACTDENMLYYVTYHPQQNKYDLFGNDGTITERMMENISEHIYNGGLYIAKTTDGILFGEEIKSGESYHFSFYKADGFKRYFLTEYTFDYPARIADVKYTPEDSEKGKKPQLWEYELTDDKIYVYRWNGAQRETLFLGPVVQSGFMEIMGDYIFHYSENSANGGMYRMLTVTDTCTGLSADIDFVNMNTFSARSDSYGVYKYDTPNTYMVQIEENDGVFTLTNVDIDMTGPVMSTIKASDDNCMIEIQDMNTGEIRLYILNK